MNIDIRKHIRNNFKDADIKDIEDSIEASIKSQDEVILPGLGVLFEIVWNNCTDQTKDGILSTLINNI